MKPIKLSELIDALEFESDEHATYIDLQNGSVVMVDNSLLTAVEEGDEEELEDLAGWEEEQMAIARAIVEDPGERFVDAPDRFGFHEYRHMERFIRTVRDAEAAGQLRQAIQGKGAFRYFKDTAGRLGLLDRWYHYRDEAMKEFVVEWAGAHGITLENDLDGQKD